MIFGRGIIYIEKFSPVSCQSFRLSLVEWLNLNIFWQDCSFACIKFSICLRIYLLCRRAVITLWWSKIILLIFESTDIIMLLHKVKMLLIITAFMLPFVNDLSLFLLFERSRNGLYKGKLLISSIDILKDLSGGNFDRIILLIRLVIRMKCLIH